MNRLRLQYVLYLLQDEYLILYFDTSQMPVYSPSALSPGASYVQTHVNDVIVTGHVRAPVYPKLVRYGFAAWPSIPFQYKYLCQ